MGRSMGSSCHLSMVDYPSNELIITATSFFHGKLLCMSRRCKSSPPLCKPPANYSGFLDARALPGLPSWQIQSNQCSSQSQYEWLCMLFLLPPSMSLSAKYLGCTRTSKMARLELYGKTADKAALQCLQLSQPPTGSADPGSASGDVDGIKRRLEEDAQLWKAASSEGLLLRGWPTLRVYHPLVQCISTVGRHLQHYLQGSG